MSGEDTAQEDDIIELVDGCKPWEDDALEGVGIMDKAKQQQNCHQLAGTTRRTIRLLLDCVLNAYASKWLSKRFITTPSLYLCTALTYYSSETSVIICIQVITLRSLH